LADLALPTVGVGLTLNRVGSGYALSILADAARTAVGI
jgi:hypothetical protein